MSTRGLEIIDHNVQLTYVWIDELNWRLAWENKAHSFQLLKSVLHALRDWLPVNEAVDLAAQLPTLLRGVYYEQWRPETTPVKKRSKAEFMNHIDRAFVSDLKIPLETAVTIVLGFLATKISAGEMQQVRQSLPADLRSLWPATAEAT